MLHRKILAPVLCAVILVSTFVPFLAVPVSAAGYPSDITADNFYGTWLLNKELTISDDERIVQSVDFYSNGLNYEVFAVYSEVGNDYIDFYYESLNDYCIAYESYVVSGNEVTFIMKEEARLVSFDADVSNPTKVYQVFFDFLTANATYQV